VRYDSFGNGEVGGLGTDYAGLALLRSSVLQDRNDFHASRLPILTDHFGSLPTEVDGNRLRDKRSSSQSLAFIVGTLGLDDRYKIAVASDTPTTSRGPLSRLTENGTCISGEKKRQFELLNR